MIQKRDYMLLISDTKQQNIRKAMKKIPKDYLVLKFPHSKDIRYRYSWNQKHIR